ncbi:hypothetical protein LEMLEM_LOCUS13514, partial [Lemmus lemmus]
GNQTLHRGTSTNKEATGKRTEACAGAPSHKRVKPSFTSQRSLIHTLCYLTCLQEQPIFQCQIFARSYRTPRNHRGMLNNALLRCKLSCCCCVFLDLVRPVTNARLWNLQQKLKQLKDHQFPTLL